MTKKKMGNVRNLITERNLDDAIYQSLLISGDILPTSENEVRFVKSCGNLTDVALPESLINCSDAIKTAKDRRQKGEKIALPDLLHSETELQKVARAARKGSSINSETEALMKEAREKAKLNTKK